MKYLLVLIFLTSCAAILDRNAMIDSDIVFRGGTHGTKSWDDKLVFDRYSWYKEINMVYDISIAELELDSPFRKWLGEELLRAGKCDRLFIGLFYAKNGAPTNTASFIQQFRESNLEDLVLLDFKKQFEAHEGFRDWRLSRHKLVGLCGRSNSRYPVQIKVPGFKDREILKVLK
ncbi:MAG: hypothetical protein CME65_02210 [Halobacteriovoraceae bacterium]|nr:hypothetical protein [Halobacteriovoraceae bacterium]|tara:strand:+ start:10458 stop:10979 length:522 start_codon:yes stop_codon:yes gene_type:complete